MKRSVLVKSLTGFTVIVLLLTATCGQGMVGLVVRNKTLDELTVHGSSVSVDGIYESAIARDETLEWNIERKGTFLGRLRITEIKKFTLDEEIMSIGV